MDIAIGAAVGAVGTTIGDGNSAIVVRGVSTSVGKSVAVSMGGIVRRVQRVNSGVVEQSRGRGGRRAGGGGASGGSGVGLVVGGQQVR